MNMQYTKNATSIYKEKMSLKHKKNYSLNKLSPIEYILTL